MLVQRRRDGLRLIRQCDHALVAARLAAEWIGLDPTPRPLPFRLVLAIALHDLAWADADREPRWDADAAAPYAFGTVDDDYREPLYRNGIDTVEAIDDYSALLKSLHFTRFLDGRSEFVAFETARQQRILARLPADHADPATVESHRELLRFFDFLSLFCLLTGPNGVNPADWLSPERVGRTPAGNAFSLEWESATELRCSPYPFRRPLRLATPARDLPLSFRAEADLADAWSSAPPRSAEIHIAGS